MSALVVSEGDGPPSSGDRMAAPIQDRIRQGRDHRKQFEPGWHSDLAFASGKFYLEWDRLQRKLVLPQDLQDKDLYTADVITEYRTSALGELGSDDDRPELLLRRDDLPSEDYQAQLNRAVGFGWDNEWDGDQALDEIDRLTLDLGTSAMRCRWEKNYGPTVADNVPFVDGQPVLDPQQAHDLFGQGPSADVTMGEVRQGRICWDPLSPFNLIVPPGVPHERYFPWECVVRPVLLSSVQEEFGRPAAGLKEDTDIGSVYGWDAAFGPDGRNDAGKAGVGSRTRLRDHVWLFTYYERSSPKYQQGRTVTLASNQMVPLRFDNQLPYQSPGGEWRTGVAYFHWWRVTGRFWSRSLVSVMKDGQRLVNRRRQQTTEIIDRGMPFVIVQKDSSALNRKGTPVEFVEVDRQEAPPVVNQGVPPGAWMQADVEAIREDLDHATGIKAVRLGENPQNVTTYSQLALINENDQGKRAKIVFARKMAIARLVEDSVYDIRRYWGPERQVALAGDEDVADASVFDATKVPPFYIVKVVKGTSRPRSQAAELKKIEDLARFSIESGQPVPIAWYKRSLDAGEALDLPEQPTDDQADKAELENHRMLMGEQVPVDYFDPPGTHIPAHRSAQIQAIIAGRHDLAAIIEQHVQAHLAAAQANAAAIQPPQPPEAPGTAGVPVAPQGPPPTMPPATAQAVPQA